MEILCFSNVRQCNIACSVQSVQPCFQIFLFIIIISSSIIIIIVIIIIIIIIIAF